MWSANTPPGIQWTQVYAGIAEPNGREFIATWSHFDYDNKKPSNDVVFRYDVDPFSHLERSVQLTGNDADAMQLRLCRAQDAVPDLQRGQDSATLPATRSSPSPSANPSPRPRPTTTARSAPPGARH